MRFDLNKDAGEIFPFFVVEVTSGKTVYRDPELNEDNTPKSWVKARLVPSELAEKIEKDVGGSPKYDFAYNPERRGMEKVDWRDQTAEQRRKSQEMTWDAVIMDWGGEAFQGIECTAENKLNLMRQPLFARYIGRVLQLLSGSV